MDNLITSERKYINQKVAELKHAAFYALKEIKEHDELIGLYQDIIRETEKHGKGTIIFDYAKLLEEQNQLYLPEEAYLFAKQSVTLNAKELLKQYHYTIAQKMNESDLCARQQSLFNEIHSLLGDTSDLISDFTQTYRRVNSTVADNIENFINLGYMARFFIVLNVTNN